MLLVSGREALCVGGVVRQDDNVLSCRRDGARMQRSKYATSMHVPWIPRPSCGRRSMTTASTVSRRWSPRGWWRTGAWQPGPKRNTRLKTTFPFVRTWDVCTSVVAKVNDGAQPLPLQVVGYLAVGKPPVEVCPCFRQGLPILLVLPDRREDVVDGGVAVLR